MALLDSIALGAAEQIRKSAGPRAGVIAYRNLLQATAEELRARAVLGGIECALDANDEHAAFSFAEAWFPITNGDWEKDVVRTVRKLDRAGYERAAFLLAETERKRRPGRAVTYALARLTERRGLGAEATALFRACIALPRGSGNERITAVAALEVARTLSRVPAGREEALALARSLDLTKLSLRQKMYHARIVLASASRFERAAALSTLAEVARADPKLALGAIRRAVAHADRLGPRLSALEVDRIKAALAAWPNERERALAIARLPAGQGSASTTAADDEARLAADPEMAPLVTKARAVLSGARGPALAESMQSAPNARATSLALEAIAEWRRGTLAPAHVAAVSHALAPRMQAPPSAHAVALAALAAEDATLQAEGGALASLVVERGAAAPRGFLVLARALDARKLDDAAERAYRLAESLTEPEASAALTAFLLRRGRAAARAGKRNAAVGYLAEAKRRRTKA